MPLPSITLALERMQCIIRKILLFDLHLKNVILAKTKMEILVGKLSPGGQVSETPFTVYLAFP